MLICFGVENFRCFRSFKVPLRRLTVLVGPNDSGKSAFLAALQYFLVGQQLQPGDRWRKKPTAEINLFGTTNEGAARRSTASGPVEGSEYLSRLSPVGFFHLSSRGVSVDSPGAPEGHIPQLDSDGGGVAALLDHLLREDRKRFDALVHAVRQLVPGVQDLLIATPDPQRRRVDLIVEKGLRIPGDAASSGVRILLFFLGLAYHPAPPKVILLEEPEAGLHPRRLGEVMNLLRQVSQGKHGGNAAQIILTTHSPYLLDLVDVKDDQVLVLRRQADGNRTADPVDAERLREFLDEFHLGEVWSNIGEEGLIARPS